jgi:tetratricopeptide (TPR) repeat protein
MRDGCRRFPGHALFSAVGSVHVAQHRGDLEEPIRRCEILRRKFPRAEERYAVAAKCLTDLGRHDEADVVIGRGVSKCSDDYDLCELHAEGATQRRDWPEALQRRNVVWRQFEQIRGLFGAAQCQTEIGRFAEVQKVLSEACERSGMNNTSPFAALADLAAAKGEFEEAVQCWDVVLRRVPSFAIAYTKGAEAMRKIGREVEADEFLRVAVTRFPSDLAVNLEYATSADRRGDWAAAIERWARFGTGSQNAPKPARRRCKRLRPRSGMTAAWMQSKVAPDAQKDTA